MNNSLDMRVNQRVLTLGEKNYKLDFDMQALSIAENVYKLHFGQDVNVSEIIVELFNVKMSAVMAFTFGAIRSAGYAITWEDFSKNIFTYEHFDDVFDVVSDAISELFKTGEEDDNANAAAEDTEKN